MYFRGSELSTGNGLGLYLVEAAVKKMHGHISLTSSPGEFTEFIIKIPIVNNI